MQELNLLELNFEGMKRILTAQSDATKQEEATKEKQEEMARNLKEKDFDELMKHSEPTVSWNCIKTNEFPENNKNSFHSTIKSRTSSTTCSTRWPWTGLSSTPL